MKKSIRITASLLALLFMVSFPVFAKVAEASNDEVQVVEDSQANTVADSTGAKAIASGLAIGLAGLGGALGMGIAIGKAADGISRQPEQMVKLELH